MKDNYLTDKTGRDADIERLETLLSEFRYVETEAPALPATNVIEFAKTPRRRRFGLIFATSVSLSLVLLVGFWLGSGETGVTREVASNVEPINTETKPEAAQPKVEPVAIEIPMAVTESKPIAIKAKEQKQTSRPSYAVYRSSKKPAERIVLTEEEKYAYNQLMLALSITSSKLRMVREKVDGTELLPSRTKVIDR